MGGNKAQLCFTSPPYWVGKDYEKETTLEEVKQFICESAHSITFAVAKDGGRIVLNTSTARAQAINPKAEVETLFSLSWWQDAFRDRNWLMRHCRLWVKSGQLAAKSVTPKSDVIDQHWEPLATFLPTFYNPDGLRRGQERIKMKWAQQGVWDDIKGTANMNEHGAAFPVELPHRYIRLYSANTELILDIFLGSGTTLIAAHQLNRICYGMEIEPKYVDVTCQRFFNLTGIDPVRESDGKKWRELQQ
jgi:site-specific DNA-methyltransferase (adenine-specific)